jgi:hypothetical protein
MNSARSIAINFDKQKFNDDLLMGKGDYEVASHRYPTLLHVLDHPELRSYFETFDAPANRAKRSSRTAGFFAIVLACIALMFAGAEHLDKEHTGMLPTVLVIVSALAGILSVVIGSMGVLFAGKKREWLHLRFMTERIRQFHFQVFVSRLPQIFASLKDDQAKAAFKAERNSWFEAFKTRFDGKLQGEFNRAVNDETSSELWLYEDQGEPEKTEESKELDPLFRAYRELRIMHQIGYASYKLREDHKIFSSSPRRQAAVLSAVAFTCIILLCAIHVGVLIGAVMPENPFWAEFRFSELVSVIVIWFAIVALGVRAMEQGLQPEREIERYQQYLSAVRAVLERFDNARSQSEKIRVMREMERLSFDEMRNFLITNDRTRFVM